MMQCPFGVETRTINGKEYAIWRNYLQDELAADTNPMLWFAKDLETHDILVCGVKTKREALAFLAKEN